MGKLLDFLVKAQKTTVYWADYSHNAVFRRKPNGDTFIKTRNHEKEELNKNLNICEVALLDLHEITQREYNRPKWIKSNPSLKIH